VGLPSDDPDVVKGRARVTLCRAAEVNNRVTEFIGTNLIVPEDFQEISGASLLERRKIRTYSYLDAVLRIAGLYQDHLHSTGPKCRRHLVGFGPTTASAATKLWAKEFGLMAE
jgi:hypothetical protein